jgi:hypothetical protein
LNSNKSPWRSTHSIGSRFAPQKESRPSHPDHLADAGPAREGHGSHAPATTAQQTPKTHPNTAIDSIASLHTAFPGIHTRNSYRQSTRFWDRL